MWKDTHKGPLVWHVRRVRIHIKDEQGLPAGDSHLLVCTQARTREVKYFLGYAPGQKLVKDLLRVAFGRWRIERCFLEGKGEVGRHPWEERRWLGLKGHLILTAVSDRFLAKACRRLRKKAGLDGLPGAHRHRRVDPELATFRAGT